MRKTIVIIVVTSILLVVGMVFIFSNNANPVKDTKEVNSNKSNREVALSCTLDMYTQFHIHPHLQIVINGQQQVIPANTGIIDNCMHPLHTHDDSGIIHVESPVKRDFTLGDFFTVWGKTFNKNQILDYKIDDQHVIKETVDEKPSQDFENTILEDKEQIVISYENK